MHKQLSTVTERAPPGTFSPACQRHYFWRPRVGYNGAWHFRNGRAADQSA